MNKMIRKIWQKRGYTDEWLDEINTCPHRLPSHIDEMCEELKKYHDSGEQVVLLTDFDTDGIMTGVIGYAGLKELGFNVKLYKMDTSDYGIGPSEIDELASEYPEAKCILMGDVGIEEYDNIAHAADLGLHVLVIDHHDPKGKVLPEADICVDPMFDEGPEYFDQICGAYVMYLMLRQYAGLYEGEESFAVQQIERLRVFAGIGTVSDSMPLWYENRVIVKDAVSFCRQLYANGSRKEADSIPGCQMYRNAFLGLFVMLKRFAKLGKFSEEKPLWEDLFGFYIAPALNSIKRLHQKVDLAYEVFFGGYDAAEKAMDDILRLNEERKRILDEKFNEMLDEDTAQPWAPYIYITDAISGLRGLLAQKAMDITGEPVLVVAKNDEGNYSGSGRAPDWFPFLTETADIAYVHPAGHEGAFGVTVDDGFCDELCQFIEERAGQLKPPESGPDLLISSCSGDADAGIDIELLDDFLTEIEEYHPFGKGFEEPEEELEFCPRKVYWETKGEDKSHVKATFPNGLELVCFGQGGFFPNGMIDKAKMPDVTKACGKLEFHMYKKKKYIQFRGALGPDMDQSDA